MDSKGIIRKRLAQHRDIIEQILADEKLQDTIAQITDTIVTCFKYGGRVYFCGNGGSAADAQHLAAEFSGKFYQADIKFFLIIKTMVLNLNKKQPYPTT